MTLAIAGLTSTEPTVPRTVPIAIIGTDAFLAALPATPVQLAHACLRAGFANVIPASWGDELIAAAVLRRLPQFGNTPMIQCSCPIVAHRLLTVGGDLRPALLALVAPPVAIARYVRTLSQPTRTRITYVGNCPGALDESIDIRMSPDALIAMLAERHIALDEQPHVFESVIPPDRRRFRSQPGGIPTSAALWSEPGSRALVELTSDDLVTELAQHVLTGKNVLIDAAVRLGCVCSGALPGVMPAEARGRIVALEPPRATTPVVEEGAPIEFDAHVPAASRSPIDVVAVSASSHHSQPAIAAPGSDMPFGHRISPVRGISSLPDLRPARNSNPVVQRPPVGPVPVTRDLDGKALPRAYVARRRSSPQGMPRVSLPLDERPATPVPPSPSIRERPKIERLTGAVRATERDQQAGSGAALSIAWPIPRRQLVYLLLAAVALVITMSAVVAVVVGRALTVAPAVAPMQR